MTMCKLVLVAGLLGLTGGLLGFATGCEEEEEYVIWECELECDYEDDDGYYNVTSYFDACDITDEDSIEDDIEDATDDLTDELEEEGFYGVSCSGSCETDDESCEQE